MRHLLWPSALALTLLGCFVTTNDVKFLRTQQPALPPGCPVNVLADAVAPYPVEDLVQIQLTYAPGGKDAAMNHLREKACYYGGDTLYAVEEVARGNASTSLAARIARRPQK